MTPEQRHLLVRVERRAEQVRKLAALALERESTFLPAVFAFVAWNLVRTLMLLCPEALLHTFTAWMHGRLREEAGLCDLCGTPKQHPTDLACVTCLKQMDDEDQQCLLWDEQTNTTSH